MESMEKNGAGNGWKVSDNEVYFSVCFFFFITFKAKYKQLNRRRDHSQTEHPTTTNLAEIWNNCKITVIG